MSSEKPKTKDLKDSLILLRLISMGVLTDSDAILKDAKTKGSLKDSKTPNKKGK